jgi:ATP phosphoribosyltransferase
VEVTETVRTLRANKVRIIDTVLESTPTHRQLDSWKDA